MSNTKPFLKAAKTALDAHDYSEAANQARKVLDADSTNYHARVFLGKALDKLGQDEESQAVYRAAADAKESDPLAWQGLISLFEKQPCRDLTSYHDAVVHMAKIWMQRDDMMKCQTVVDRYTSEAKKYGTQAQYKHSLRLLLPDSPIFDYLEGRLPRPEHTFQRLAEITEMEEQEKINSEIGQRRTRLGARVEQVVIDVKREILPKSDLEDIYSKIVVWAHDDEVRRLYEEKLLQYAYETLTVLPTAEKALKRRAVEEMARGMVILKHPFLLAWTIYLEWNDPADLNLIDHRVLCEFVECFPEEGLGKVIRGFIGSEISHPVSPNEEPTGTAGEGPHFSIPSEDRLILMTEGLETASQSILAHRIMGEYYLHLEEHENAVGTLKDGLPLVASKSKAIGVQLVHTEDALNVALGTALIQYQSPRHHTEARSIFERVLDRDASNTQALLGIGLIYEEQDDFKEAIAYFHKIKGKSRNARIKAESAWCKACIGDDEIALQELKDCLVDMNSTDSKTKALRSQTLYRMGMCLWRFKSDRKSRKDRSGAYAYYLSSLQADVTYAPTYTALGNYYADCANDKKRAARCFHKAFELSAAEVEAAYRLARSFSESGDWEIVEIVAQRVIDSGKARPPLGSKRKAIAWPFAALGVVQLNNQEYHKSIVSFQSALRGSPHDYHSWVGLGESYHYSGRYIAATRAFEHAQDLKSARHEFSGWFTEYMLANVKRELGEHDDAVAGYRRVLKEKPGELGVCVALLQTLVERAARSLELGIFGRSTDSAKEALQTAEGLVDTHPKAFNLWRVVGDACSIFCKIQSPDPSFPVTVVRSILHQTSPGELSVVLSDLDGINQGSLTRETPEESAIPLPFSAALLAYKRGIAVAADDAHARAVAWYNLGWAEISLYDTVKVVPGKGAGLRFRKAGVQCFKKAIELEASNSEFWNSLGIATCDLSPRVSQHAFVRSLFLDEKNARVWANLGAFYMIQGDLELASESFTRAQSSDPAYPQGWLGQGFLAAERLDHTGSFQLFAHAYEIADSSDTLTKSLYSTKMFDQVISRDTRLVELLRPLLSLHQLRAQRPSDWASQHLSSLFAERVGNLYDAEATLEDVCSRLESEYEKHESSELLVRFSQAKADLARLQLGLEKYEAAVDNANMALDLSNEEPDSDTLKKIRLSAHMTAGLGYAHSGSLNDAIKLFKQALTEDDGDSDIVCLLSQVLWAGGGDHEQDVAREQLFNCIEEHGAQSNTTTLLGAISVLDDETDTMAAVATDLENLLASDEIDTWERIKVMEVLGAIDNLQHSSNAQTADLSRTQSTTMLSPSLPEGWIQLAGLCTEPQPAEMAILAATKAVTPKGGLEAEDLCRALSGSARPDDAQRAIMVAPYYQEGWTSLL